MLTELIASLTPFCTVVSLISFVVDRVGDSRLLLVSPAPIALPCACRGFDRPGTCVLCVQIEAQTGEAFEVTGRPLISSEIADEIANSIIRLSRPDRPLAERGLVHVSLIDRVGDGLLHLVEGTNQTIA